ncbi:hypothetical protein [Tsukamurella ocularis]|uniref:hypothetical protein n=1 Tax=Tsukamurella ocularis TaxID=1970234 RepID=UPI002168BC8F|nr:hypothetical protein [Tsukamurella ocularis]MCS3779260.1 hypothetical protein [Tsukamurella ocularis]MCS3787120.1 hypothetical protein [Tsukamurella ocularis]MCS3852511.1 hypothetical protein [Tsukamurella ocularis]
MAGPRGRALCVFAGLPSAAWRSLWDLELEPDMGGSVPWYRAAEDRLLTDSQYRSVQSLQLALTEPEVLDAAAVRGALEHTVGNAVYWQDPRDEELVGSMPQLASPLQRIAQGIEALPEVGWWTAPFSADQHRVRYLPFDEVAALDSPAAEILAEAFRSRDLREPPGYMSGWWSAPPFGLVRTCPVPGGEPSGLFLVEDGFGQQRASVHSVTSSRPRVLEIDSGESWAELCRHHPLDVTNDRSRDWLTTTGLADTRWVMPDWRSVAEEYDAVHLQVGAYLAASGTAIEVEPGVHSVIAGWAPGDTFWLTDVVEVEPRGRIFVKDRDDDLWHPEED